MVLKSLKQFLLESLGREAENEADREHALRVTTAALMIEVARADFREDVAENERIFEALKQHFSLQPAEVELIMEQAATEVDEAVSLYEFTRMINDQLGPDDKSQLVRLMWQIGFADNHIHRYEENLIRKVAELLYVPPSELLRLRHEAESAASARSGYQAG